MVPTTTLKVSRSLPASPVKPEVKYPIILQSTLTDTIFLMCGERFGVVLWPGNTTAPAAGTSGHWCEDNMVPYTGKLTLENT